MPRTVRFLPLSALPMLAVALAGCGGGPSPEVDLEDQSNRTGDKALVFMASTDEKLVQQGGNLVLELRGIDTRKSPQATYKQPDYSSPVQCTASPCEWTVVPEHASDYEFTAFVVDVESHEASGESDAVEARWTAPPRPQDFAFLINGKSYELTPLSTGIDEYLPIAPGKLRVEATWTGDAAGTGYEIAISNGQVDHVCTTGTSCVLPVQVPIRDEQEMNWRVRVRTARGEKEVEGFQVCLVGAPA